MTSKIEFIEISSNRCFSAITNDDNIINIARSLEGTNLYRFIVGIIRIGNYGNTCNTDSHNWHFETLAGIVENTAEECNTVIYGIEQDPDIWLNRTANTCLYGKVQRVLNMTNIIQTSSDNFDAWWCGCGCDGHIGTPINPDYIEALMPVSDSTICCDNITICNASSIVSKNRYPFKTFKCNITFNAGNNAIGKNVNWTGNSMQIMLHHEKTGTWCGPEIGMILDLNSNPIKFMAYIDGLISPTNQYYNWSNVYLPIIPDNNEHEWMVKIDDVNPSKVHFYWDGIEQCYLDVSSNISSNCTDGSWCQCNTYTNDCQRTTYYGPCPCPGTDFIDFNTDYYIFIGTHREGNWDGTNYGIKVRNITIELCQSPVCDFIVN